MPRLRLLIQFHLAAFALIFLFMAMPASGGKARQLAGVTRDRPGESASRSARLSRWRPAIWHGFAPQRWRRPVRRWCPRIRRRHGAIDFGEMGRRATWPGRWSAFRAGPSTAPVASVFYWGHSHRRGDMAPRRIDSQLQTFRIF